MLVESISGSLFDASIGVEESDIDWVDFHWHECFRRALRKRSRAGRDLRLLLPMGQCIRHGDLLGACPDSKQRIAVHVLPAELLVVRCDLAELLAKLAYELGNLHVPVEIGAGELITPPDGPVEAAIENLGMKPARESRRFAPMSSGIVQASVAAGFEIIPAP